MDRCDECGFVYDEVDLLDALDELRCLPDGYGAHLRPAEAAGLARQRPDPQTWSALEYTCHLRDVLRVQAERIVSALEHDRPTFEPMGREELVVSAAYNQQVVEVVLTELGEAAVAFAERCAGLDADDWQRTGVYTWPAEAERTLAWLVRHTLHEGRHHLDDVAEVVARVSG